MVVVELLLVEPGLHLDHGLERLELLQPLGVGRPLHAQLIDDEELALGEHVRVVRHVALGFVAGRRGNLAGDALLERQGQDGFDPPLLVDRVFRRLVEAPVMSGVRQQLAADDPLQARLFEGLLALGIGGGLALQLGAQIGQGDLVPLDHRDHLALGRRPFALLPGQAATADAQAGQRHQHRSPCELHGKRSLVGRQCAQPPAMARPHKHFDNLIEECVIKRRARGSQYHFSHPHLPDSGAVDGV